MNPTLAHSTPAHSLWRASTSNTFASPPLEAHVTTDVVIIGGGYSGLSAALHLAQQGVDVQVVEAHSIGFGGSGRNVGLVNAGLWVPPDQVEAQLGHHAGHTLNQALAAAPDLVFQLIEQHQIDCQPVRNGTLHCANNSVGLADLKRRLAQQQKRHAPVQLLDANTTETRTGSGQFIGALFDPRAGTIQPLNYAFGLAHAAVAAGAHIYPQSPALSYHHDDNQWRVTTATGSINANQLILATNAYDLNLTATPHHTPVHFCQFATQPLSTQQRAHILPQGEGCWDTAQVMSSFRLDNAGRLIIGGVGCVEDAGKQTHVNWAHRQLRALFPQVTDYQFQYAWSGCIAMTPDHLPKIAHIGPQAISLYGYSGRGIGPATVLGKAAAQWAMGADPASLPVAITLPKADHFAPIKAHYYNTGARVAHWFGRRLGR
ncbi:MAG: FAD-binding oxidoreductase [Oceanospirillaceae bacterium]|nr:FAD-binding oxidoreductase [Oceanospirillaceae bacterium]MBT4442106.1 FAD-binding oxidoreductase [Oceanospirillaceae bacterium]